MSLLRFFSLQRTVKEQQGSQFNKEKGTPFFSDFFYSYPFLLIFVSQFLYSFYLHKESSEKTAKKDQTFLFSLFSKLFRFRYQNINITYILKDDLKRLWDYRDIKCTEKFLDSWTERARESGIRALEDFTKTLNNHRYGLLNHSKYPIDSGKLEATNNNIKVIKRIAYGFHDDEYFILKIKQGCS